PTDTTRLCDGTVPTDQRGEPRPGPTGCTIGAVEVPAIPDHLLVDDPADRPDPNPGDTVCGEGPGACTLRAAIDETNAHPHIDTIEIAPDVDPVILRTGRHEDLNARGDYDVLAPLIIRGNGATIDAQRYDRILHAHAA